MTCVRVSARPTALIQFAASATLVLAATVAGRSDEPVDFPRQVAAILQQRCLRCHQPANRKGDISLATSQDLISGGYVAPGDPEASALLEIVTSPDDGERPQMPKEGSPLSADQVSLLRSWIAAGAPWPDDLVLREASKADATWWSLQPLVKMQPACPPGIPHSWSYNPIDRFIYARLAEKGLQPNPPADRRTLVRRLTFDLTGLPPTPAEVEAFVNDGRPDAYERLVERLLASPRYGEQWGRHWLDVIRFGESTGFERNVSINNAWPMRDYVIRSFNEDKPFDQFIVEHLAGDVVAAGDPNTEIATTFLVCGPYDNVGNQDPVQAAQIRANTIDEMIRATAEAFLGMTIGCARCHDHKFDPVSQRDYYALYATFAGVYHGSRVLATDDQRRQHEQRVQPWHQQRERLVRERAQLNESLLAQAESHADALAAQWVRPPVDRTGTEESFPPIAARFVRLTAYSVDADPKLRTGFRIDEFEVWTPGPEAQNVALASRGARAFGDSRRPEDFADAYSPQLTIDGRYGARWIAAGPELTIKLPATTQIARVIFSSDRNNTIGQHPETTFVGDYRIGVSQDGRQWVEVANSYDRKPVSDAHRRQRLMDHALTADQRARLAQIDQQLAQVNNQIEAAGTLPIWWAGQFQSAPGPFHVFLGGDPQRHGQPVVPASLQVLVDLPNTYQLPEDADEAQRRLALARWITAPSNPLTARVVANRLWHYHFGVGIVDTPSDLGYMGGRPTHPELLDYLATGLQQSGWSLKTLHRLIVTSETYRQSSAYRADGAAVDVDSRLLWRFPPRRLTAEEIRDSMLSVAGVLKPTIGGPGFRLYRYLEDNVATYVPLDEHGPETYRRSVYHQNARAARVDLLSDFDCPDNAFAAPRRATTTTALQALTLMNHQFTLDMAEQLAQRLRSEAGIEPARQVDRAFALLFGRTPLEIERNAAVDLITAHGLPAFCRALWNANEFVYVD